MNNSSNLDILVPNLPESVLDATVAIWHKKEGDKVKQDEILLEIETDKIMLEIPSIKEGILEKILEKEGAIVVSGQTLGHLKFIDNITNIIDSNVIMNDQNQKKSVFPEKILDNSNIQNKNNLNFVMSPSIRKLISEHNLNIDNIQGSGIKGRLTKQDIESYIQKQSLTINNTTNVDVNKLQYEDISKNNIHQIKTIKEHNINTRKDTRITMNRLRKKISERLLKVTNSTAMLTTFNEVNMKSIITLRDQYKELFEKQHGIKLGFMSFFVKAVLEGLRRYPEINASINEEEIIYYNYFDISIAISTTRGLVTPVLRDVDKLDMSDIEKEIKFLSEKSKSGKLTLQELKGGNFTITNGGIFGSLMSTPIINPPQSAILGMHAIKERPVASSGKIVILPMMYLALSYDHRLIDGKDSVNFLKTIKELIENPIRLLLNL